MYVVCELISFDAMFRLSLYMRCYRNAFSKQIELIDYLIVIYADFIFTKIRVYFKWSITISWEFVDVNNHH